MHAAGYCVGGTMLTVALAAMAAWHDERIMSATLFASQVDFTYAGDLKVFIDEEQVKALEQRMAERGYLEGKTMAIVFNMLRSNDLLWPYVINNYLKGKAPFPFDLLYWNSDSTRLPAANHSFYMRNCYLDNKLARGEMMLGNTPIDVHSIKIPIYNLATREDHIAPAKSVMLASKFFGGKVRFVVTGSGHIAGVVNPPDKKKYQYWTGPRPRSANVEAWLAKAKEHPGSWWPDWFAWIKQQDPTEVPARIPGGGKLKPGCAGKLREGQGLRRKPNRQRDAAGSSYVRRYKRSERAGIGPRAPHGNSATCSNPMVSGKPSMRFMFCTAWPDAPLVRLSSAEPIMARPAMRSAATPMKVMLEPRTWRVCGSAPNGSTCTNGSFA